MREMECTRWFILTLRGFVCVVGESASALGDRRVCVEGV